MDSSNQSSPPQTSTNAGNSNAVASSSTPKASGNTSTETKVSDLEIFQRTTGHMGGWIKQSDLNHPDKLAV
ncbi:hypothetical protein N7517_004079 [Penicillium concentricum]|uniref:Uncharacterized protein n=1 Tax=Penicillium concentricum TaxID=293559 RepID=A0A9W9S9H8_9EURO|nr:uncharacterized protein N7517_004079 [Penicillium concentricum]KAJ5372073.1 hypothetical protein N7517_004079 [Penicillium concentricum]